MKAAKKPCFHIAVRKRNGVEFFDTYTLTTNGEDTAREMAKDQDLICGYGWGERNPVVRIARVKLEEL